MVLMKAARLQLSLRWSPSLHSCPKHLEAFSVFQELPGHEDITTTEIYLHVAVGANGLGLKSPLDTLVPHAASF